MDDMWTELSVAECVRTAQDRTAWKGKVSLALVFESQSSPVRSCAMVMRDKTLLLLF